MNPRDPVVFGTVIVVAAVGVALGKILVAWAGW